MEMKKKIILSISIIFFFGLCTLSAVIGKETEYPEKPIQLLVGYSAGSVSDLSARALARVASKYLEKPLVVVNMPGAGATVASNELVKSAPDGHTIISLTTGYFAYAVHEQKIPFDPKLIKPVLGYWEYSHIMFTRAESPYTKLEDLISFGQKNPGGIKFSHPGRGSGPHLMGLVFFKSANIRAVDVPFKGSGENVSAVLGGHTTVGIDDFAPAKKNIEAGTLKALVACTDQRRKDLPYVPTTKEVGFADVSIFNPLGIICIHKDTPVERTSKLHNALKKAVEDPELIKIFDNMGQRSQYSSPEIVEGTISRAEKIAVPLLKELNLFIE